MQDHADWKRRKFGALNCDLWRMATWGRCLERTHTRIILPVDTRKRLSMIEAKPTECAAGAKPVERVFLIDSMSHIFRAFFAPMMNRVAPLSNSQGQVTQAVFIFTNMLRKLLQDEKPNYIAAIFESKEKTFRHETFAGYKANRLAMPDDLASQMPYIVRLCEAFNLPIINAPGMNRRRD